MPLSKLLLTDCNLATMTPVAGGLERDYGVVKNGAVAIEGDKILWCGHKKSLPVNYLNWPSRSCQGRWLLPGFTDCHTHLVYAGNRVAEWEQRLLGASYAKLAEEGGGILSTVNAVRNASEDELLRQSRPRLQQMVASGTRQVEIKSGYGLDTENEMKMLRVARKLGDEQGLPVHTSFLGAHALPPEYENQKDAYLDMLVSEMLPELASKGLVDSVDAFCEGIGFSLAQSRRILEKAVQLGLPVRLHAEQLSNLGGAAMAAELGALSCDHLEYLDEAGVRAMAEAGSIAVLLPGAYYFLGESQKPPVELLRKYGVPMAVASDCNPGSSPTTSLPLMASMAVQFFGLTPQEALTGVTVHAARALGKGQTHGQIAPGYMADLVIWDIYSPAEIACEFGNCLHNEPAIF